MWKLKYIYRHQSCEYSDKAMKLGITMNWYPVNNWREKEKGFVTALLICDGPEDKIDRFFRYIKRISVETERVSSQAILHVRKVTKQSKYFDTLYDPRIIFAKPIIHKNGLEYTELMSWTKEPLSNLLLARRQDKDTEVLELQMLGKESISNIHLLNAVPSLTSHQNEIFQFAVSNGYYTHPRKITLDTLAQMKKLSKTAFHDALRRAESHLFS